MQLGDAYGGERRRVVFCLHVPQLAELGPVPVADLVVRYVTVGDEVAAHEKTVAVIANAVSAAEAAAAAPDSDVHEEVLILKAARAREQAIRLADAGAHGEARRLLQSAATDLDTLPSDLARTQAGELRAAEHRLSPELYDGTARKQIWFDKHRAQRRRRSS